MVSIDFDIVMHCYLQKGNIISFTFSRLSNMFSNREVEEANSML